MSEILINVILGAGVLVLLATGLLRGPPRFIANELGQSIPIATVAGYHQEFNRCCLNRFGLFLYYTRWVCVAVIGICLIASISLD